MHVLATDKTKQRITSGELAHLFVGEEGELRDLWVERMFLTLFNDEPLDDDFKHNFRTYMFAFFGSDDNDITDQLFEDDAYAGHFIRSAFGLCGVKPITDEVRNDGLLEIFQHCTHTATLRCQYSNGGEIVANGPSAVRAYLLTIICVFRWMANKHFAETLQADGGVDADQATDHGC